MRQLLLSGMLLLAACGGNAPANNAAMAEESENADSTALNDTTAIDAATGQAAEMAADVNYTFNEDTANTTGDTTSNRSKTSNRSAPAFEPDEPGVSNNSTD